MLVHWAPWISVEKGRGGRGEEKRKAREIKGFACRGASSVVSERVQFAMKLAVSAEG